MAIESTISTAALPDTEQGQASSVMVASSEELARKHGGLTASEYGRLPPKPGSKPRGRPRKNGVPAGSTSNIPKAGEPSGVQDVHWNPQDSTTGNGYARPPLDPTLIRRSINSIIGWCEKLGQRVFRRKLKPLIGKRISKEDANRIVGNLKADDADKQLISENLPIVLSKYNVDSEYTPEVGLGVGCIGMGMSIVNAMEELNDILADEAEREAKQKGSDETTS